MLKQENKLLNAKKSSKKINLKNIFIISKKIINLQAENDENEQIEII